MSDAAQASERFVVDDISDDVKSAMAELATGEPVEEQPKAVEETPQPEAKELEVKTDERLRGPDGKFVAKEKDEQPQEKPVEAKPEVKAEEKPLEQKPPEQPGQAEQKVEDKSGPPPSYSVAAKLAFDKADPALRSAIAKRETEINAGLAELRDYKDLKPYRERASRAGQSLGQALEAYTGIEELFRRNPEQGFLHVADNLRQTMSPQQIGQMLLSAAQRFGAVPQNQPVPEHQTQGDDPLLSITQLIEKRLSPLEGTLNQFLQQQQTSQVNAVAGVVERFRSDPQHKFFDNLQNEIEAIIKGGLVQRTGDHAADLAKAYELACWQHPEIRAQLINEQTSQKTEAQRQAEKAIADKAKAASKSLNGSAAPGTVITEKTDGADDLEADVRKAYRQHAA